MSAKEFLGFIKDVSRDPFGQIKKYSGEGRRMAGFLCSYVPEELIYASGLLPVRLLGRATQITQTDRYLQTYCCSQVRAFYEDYLNGDYDALEGIFFAQTCDTMQSFYDIFTKNNPDKFKFNMNFPAKVKGEAPRKYALAEMKRVRALLEQHTGAPITAEKLAGAVQVYNRNRELLDKLYEVHANNPDAFPSVTLLQAVLASMFMDKKDLNPKLEEFLAGFNTGAAPKAARKKLLIVGSVNINEELYDLADEFGATIADDDICTGRRYFQGKIAEASDDGLVKRYMDRPHCPAKHGTNTDRGEYLTAMAKKHNASGVIFLYLKFCDPHAFDYPYMRDMLERAGFRSHHIEIEQSVAQSGQLRTKLQAFIETL